MRDSKKCSKGNKYPGDQMYDGGDNFYAYDFYKDVDNYTWDELVDKLKRELDLAYKICNEQSFELKNIKADHDLEIERLKETHESSINFEISKVEQLKKEMKILQARKDNEQKWIDKCNELEKELTVVEEKNLGLLTGYNDLVDTKKELNKRIDKLIDLKNDPKLIAPSIIKPTVLK